jgi:hypothetical protein
LGKTNEDNLEKPSPPGRSGVRLPQPSRGFFCLVILVTKCNEVVTEFVIADHSREWNNTTTQEDGDATRHKKKSLLLLLSYLFFNSKVMTLIPVSIPPSFECILLTASVVK